METQKFRMIMDMLRIIKKNKNPDAMRSAIEIADVYESDLEIEQRAAVFREIMDFRHTRPADEDYEREYYNSKLKEFISHRQDWD